MCRNVQNSRNILDILSYTICDLSTVNDAIYITKLPFFPLHYFTHCKTVKSKSHFIRVSTKHHTRLLSQLILAVCVKERDFHLHFFSSPLSFPSLSSISLGLGTRDRKTLGSSKAGHRKSTACYFWKLFDLIFRVGIWEFLNPPITFFRRPEGHASAVKGVSRNFIYIVISFEMCHECGTVLFHKPRDQGVIER